MAKNSLNGWINLDKPKGLSSMQALAKVKWLLKPMKAGHAGTLDPLANGVLPLALGEATKLINIAGDCKKTYRFTVQFGSKTSTDDLEGDVVATSLHIPQKADILAVLPDFTGVISQIPPIYSAKKVNGERAYALAREGVAFELAPQIITVYDLQLIETPSESSATFDATVSKGTYIRSLGRDIAEKLGTVGHITLLERRSVGKFSIERTISLAKIEEIVHKGVPANEGLPFLQEMDSVLDDILVLDLGFETNGLELAQKLRQGQTIRLNSSANHAVAVAKHDGKIIALGEQSGYLFKPKRVLHY